MSNTKLFADDMKVYRLLRDTKEDVEELQKLRSYSPGILEQ